MTLSKNLGESGINGLHNRVNSILNLRFKSFNPIPLGPRYSTLSYADAARNLTQYRATKNWEEPSAEASLTRRETTIRNMLAYDAGLPTGVTGTLIVPWSDNDYVNHQLQLARLDVQKALSKFYKFSPENLRFPNGEGFTPLKGHTNIVAKLRDISTLEVTEDCFDLAATVLYKVPALKAVMRDHFKWSYPVPHRRALYQQLVGAIPASRIGFEIFKIMLQEIVTFVDGMRIETVPKNNEVDRCIGCEPFLNMLVQSVVEEGIRDVIKKHYGIDLETSQELHKKLISDLSNATADFSNASNSSLLCFGGWFYRGTTMFNHVLQSRCSVALARIGGENIRQTLNMVAPMGNGFTFGYMTLTILAIARQFDSFAHVYGDDLIIDSDCAKDALEALSSIGYKTNEKKTFLNGTFRESCGGFFCEKYITSFEFNWCTDALSAATAINKVLLLAETYESEWRTLHNELLKVTPVVLWRLTPCNSEIPRYESDRYKSSTVENRWVIVPRSKSRVRTALSDPIRKELTSVWLNKPYSDGLSNREYLKEIQVDPQTVSAHLELKYKNVCYRSLPIDNVRPAWVAHYLWGGRVTPPSVRQKAEKRNVKYTTSIEELWSPSSPGLRRCETGGRWLSHYGMYTNFYV